MIGIGDSQCQLAVYIANRPPIEHYQQREDIKAAKAGELSELVEQSGNHWRKIINIYAKLGFQLNPQSFTSWQSYRDEFLLTQHSKQALLFDNEIVRHSKQTISLIAGRTHATHLLEEDALNWKDFSWKGFSWKGFSWKDKDFAIHKAQRVIVCPYFDYRQLSNAKLDVLVSLIKSLA